MRIRGLLIRWATGARALWLRAFRERPDDPLPMEAVAIAIVTSIGAIIAALTIDGRDFRGYDFVINLLASISLLGPGLLITNVLARNWRHKRHTEEMRRLFSFAGLDSANCRLRACRTDRETECLCQVRSGCCLPQR